MLNLPIINTHGQANKRLTYNIKMQYEMYIDIQELFLQTGSSKKAAKEGVRMNGNVRDSSPLSPSNKSNKEVIYTFWHILLSTYAC